MSRECPKRSFETHHPEAVYTKKVQVFDTPQVSTVLRSNLMRLYSPVDLTGNLIMIEKLVSGVTWTRDLPIFSPTR